MKTDDEVYRRSGDRIRLDLYRLVTIFYSSPTLRELQDEGTAFDAIAGLRTSCENQEIHDLLLRLAAGYRTFIDQRGPQAQGALRPGLRDRCGELWSPKARETTRELLTLREGCNKILHADRIERQFLAHRDPSRYSLLPRVHLHGKHKRKSWTAELDIVRFVELLFFRYRGDAA